MSEEFVMVVKCADLFGETKAFYGLDFQNTKFYLDNICCNYTFLLRSKAEKDLMYKQIIPYLVFTCGGKYFLMQRKHDCGEKRLANKISLGIGGHINEIENPKFGQDSVCQRFRGKKLPNEFSRKVNFEAPVSFMCKESVSNDKDADKIFCSEGWRYITQGAMREFTEEIEYYGNFNVRTIGFINDDSNSVGQVHLGLLFLIEGDSEEIRVKSELKSGNLVSLGDCDTYFGNMETWSKFVYKWLSE